MITLIDNPPLSGKFSAANRGGLVFSAAHQTPQALSAGLSTTYTGILLQNPLGSGRLLSVIAAKYALSSAPVASANMGLISGSSVLTATTPMVIQPGVVGAVAAGVGLVFSAATLGSAPVWREHLRDSFTAGAFPEPGAVDWFDGRLIIAPGGFVAFGASTVVTGFGFISWEEVTQ